MSDEHGWRGVRARYRALSKLSVPAAYPVAQFPNAPLWVALAAMVVGRFVSGEAKDYATAVGAAGLIVWAWLELFDGVNLFRRVLGLVVLVTTVVGLAGKIG